MRHDNDDDNVNNNNVDSKRCGDDDEDDDDTTALGLGLLPPDIQAATTWEVAVTNIED